MWVIFHVKIIPYLQSRSGSINSKLIFTNWVSYILGSIVYPKKKYGALQILVCVMRCIDIDTRLYEEITFFFLNKR